jgi:hypothetical protein
VPSFKPSIKRDSAVNSIKLKPDLQRNSQMNGSQEKNKDIAPNIDAIGNAKKSPTRKYAKYLKRAIVNLNINTPSCK